MGCGFAALRSLLSAYFALLCIPRFLLPCIPRLNLSLSYFFAATVTKDSRRLPCFRFPFRILDLGCPFLAQLCGFLAFSSQRPEAESVVALGQAQAGFVLKQRAMVESRRVQF